jgi:uncharacterized protein YdhG (YjbR/CyaY superfamily)
MRTAWHTLGSQHGLPARPTTVPAYLASLPSRKRAEFEALRDWVRGVLPDAAETMSYKMPTYEGRGKICAIAAQKRYFALYICETDTLERHRSRIRFAHFEDLPRGAARKLLREAAREPA